MFMNSEEALAIVELALQDNHLSKLQRTVFCQAWEEQSYLEIARRFGYELGYVKQTGSQLWQLLSDAFQEKVTKHNLQVVLKRQAPRMRATVSESAIALEPRVEPSANRGALLRNSALLSSGFVATLPESQVAIAPPRPAALPISAPAPVADWGDAVDLPAFYGRDAELQQIEDWIMGDRCWLILILGMGGIGKTTTVVNVGAGLALKGARVLLVDTDAQGNLAMALGIHPRRTLYDVLVDGAPAERCIVEARPGLDLLPADATLLGAQPIIARRPDWSRVLAQALQPVAGAYDFVLIDSAGSLTPLNVNAYSDDVRPAGAAVRRVACAAPHPLWRPGDAASARECAPFRGARAGQNDL